jgi:hypothetical protein
LGAIIDVYKKTRKARDLFWNTYVARPPAAIFVHWLGPTRVTPDQVTLAAFVVASLSAVGIVFLPGYWGLLAAIVVFEFSYVLDCVDGMLARLRATASTAGHLLDFLMDEIKAFTILGAVSVRLYRDRADVLYLFVGVGGLVALASGIALTTFLRRPEIAGQAADAHTVIDPAAPKKSLASRLIGLPMSVAKFLVHYPSYILYTAVAGHIELYFFPYVAVNVLYAFNCLATLALRFGKWRRV